MDQIRNNEKTSMAGHAWQAAIDYGIDVSQTEYLMSLTPLQRLIRHDQALDLVLAMRQAGIKHYGFDPNPPETPDRPER